MDIITIFLFWIGFAVVVGVAANTRGRSGLGWFFLALLFSPLLAGLLLLALPSAAGQISHTPKPMSSSPAPINFAPTRRSSSATTALSAEAVFEPDGVYAGVPYKVEDGGTINAMMAGGRVRFREMNQFIAAVTGGSTHQDRVPWNGVARGRPRRSPAWAGSVNLRVPAG
jgi:hypothetical protein